jgi:hypothetical protein
MVFNISFERKIMATSTKSPKSAKKGFANPYREGSCYHAIVAALMPANRRMQYADFATKVRKEWKGWREFAAKKPQVKTGRDANGKLYYNATVIQRADYGEPLHSQGACIDLTRDGKGELFICLNTHSRKPQTPGRAPAAGKVTNTVKAVKAVKRPKAAKPKAKAPKIKKAAAATAPAKPPILEGREASEALKAA